MRVRWAWLLVGTALAACAPEKSPYAKAVAHLPPLYCYRTLADVDCYDRPVFRDRRALTNFQGPSPDEYEAPVPPEPASLQPPPEIDHVCRMGEPDPCRLPDDTPAIDTAPPSPPAADTAPPAPSAGEEPADT